MIIRRTANSGVLLELDGVNILLDGVCRDLPPYLGTPDSLRQSLYACPPDIVAFTHGHVDHFDRAFAKSLYEKTLRPIIGPESLLREGLTTQPVRQGGVTVTPIVSRHLGKAGQDTPHVSFLIEGSRRILFTGDATPLLWKEQRYVDVLIGPYVFASSSTGWRIANKLTNTLVLLHLPEENYDPSNLWDAVNTVTKQEPGPQLFVPKMGEKIEI